jgi:hypothetical protein
MRLEPFVYKVYTLLMRSDEFVDLFDRQVCTISLMVGIADLIQMFFQDMEVWLRQPDPKDDGVVGSR